tara:strand:+ start:41546 stop:42487 length:942 start_codon:yes stop_codon:yes gene_type:complete
LFVPYAFDAMGCRFELLIGIGTSGASPGLSRGDGLAIGEELRDLVLDWHGRLSVFEPGSMVSLINHDPAGFERTIDDELFELFTLCEQMRQQTCGTFNIASGTLMHAHGFREECLEELNGLSLAQPIVLDERRRTITKTDDRIRLDLGAIAKGHMLDLIADELNEIGIANAFIHGGTSSALGLGGKPNGQPWAVRLGEGLDVQLNGHGLGVSEGASQTRMSEDSAIRHVMDPRSGLPVDNQIQRSACVHNSAAIADAYSTACTVSPELAEQFSTDPCTMVLFGLDQATTMHDILSVVRQNTQIHADDTLTETD